MTAEPNPPPARSRLPSTPAEIEAALARQRRFLKTLQKWWDEDLELPEEAGDWETLKALMNETRRELGQPPIVD